MFSFHATEPKEIILSELKTVCEIKNNELNIVNLIGYI